MENTLDPQAPDKYATAFEAFLHEHPISTAILVATLVSWVATAFLKPWIPVGPNKKRWLRSFDVLVATTLAGVMLYGHLGWQLWIGLSLLVGGSSPFGYFGFSEALCWKWPGAKRYLSLRELHPDEEPPPLEKLP